MGQFSYYKLGQKHIAYRGRFVITYWGGFIANQGSHCESVSVSLLQIIGTGITNLGNYYKLAHSNCKKNCEITIVLNKRVASSAPMK